VFVNGELVTDPKVKVTSDDVVSLGEVAAANMKGRMSVVFHKPRGIVSSMAEDDKIPAIRSLVAAARVGGTVAGAPPAARTLQGLVVAGRLDEDSTGLLVFTQDGRLARRLIDATPTGGLHHAKEYTVDVSVASAGDTDKQRRHWPRDSNPHVPAGFAAVVTSDALKASPTPLLQHVVDERAAMLEELSAGLLLDDAEVRECDVEWTGAATLRFRLRQGKKRQIRRMCALVGLRVDALHRDRIGSLTCAGLREGQWRYIGEHEIRALHE
jgi:23S rRNA pseudouridine2604 synthase